MWASPFWLLVAMVAAGAVAAPFYALWPPLGYVVAVPAYCLAWALLWAFETRRREQRRVVAAASARVSVRSRHGG